MCKFCQGYQNPTVDLNFREKTVLKINNDFKYNLDTLFVLKWYNLSQNSR